MEYPKIHSLWKRNGWYFNEEIKKDPSKQAGRQSFIVGDYACEEFGNIKIWDVEEKIDGTNIRIFFKDGQVRFGGRTKDAQIPCHLLDYLQAHFTPERLAAHFGEKIGLDTQVILFGEGFGPKIQSGGLYSAAPGFCLFDVRVGSWWLEKEAIRKDIGPDLGVSTPPFFGYMDEEEIITFVKAKMPSAFARNDPNSNLQMEGVVCRPKKALLFRNGDPLMFKLKTKEF